MRKFIESESGAVTVDWVVLTALVVGLSIAALASIPGAVEEVGEEIGTAVELSPVGNDKNIQDK